MDEEEKKEESTSLRPVENFKKVVSLDTKSRPRCCSLIKKAFQFSWTNNRLEDLRSEIDPVLRVPDDIVFMFHLRF